jgi:cytochrome c oxidase subunit 2
MIEKIARINQLRTKKSADLVAAGNTALDPYTFDYLLLCNKICGASHYNMQMKIVVDTPEEYKAWLSDKVALVKEVKASNEPAPAADGSASDSTAVSSDTVASKVAMK